MCGRWVSRFRVAGGRSYCRRAGRRGCGRRGRESNNGRLDPAPRHAERPQPTAEPARVLRRAARGRGGSATAGRTHDQPRPHGFDHREVLLRASCSLLGTQPLLNGAPRSLRAASSRVVGPDTSLAPARQAPPPTVSLQQPPPPPSPAPARAEASFWSLHEADASDTKSDSDTDDDEFQVRCTEPDAEPVA